ncbi:MAG: TonB-dependent receptor family protein [Bacteroidales bacterium]|nr:TonB-dependent receptor family protein [Bacteroidales bacterium]
MAILAMSMASAVTAQNAFTLRGTLMDAKGEALPFANCVLLQQGDSAFAYGTTSGFDGVFSLAGVTQGIYILRITAVGHETWWQDISVVRDTNLGAIEIADNATALKEVQVTASRPLYSADGEKVFYNVSDDPSVQSGNAVDALQNAPGVEVDAEGNIKYRGGAEVTIWINDKPSHLKAEGLKQYLKSLPAGTLQRIEVIAHPSAKYHTKNCVINIVTTAKVKRNELLCLGLNANTRPQAEPWVDYVWANEKLRFNLFVSGNYDSYDGSTSNESHLLAPDSTLSSVVSTKGRSANRTFNGNFGLDFDYNIDSNTLVNLWLWTTASHDSASLSSRTERTEFIHGPGRYFYNEMRCSADAMADAAFGVMMEKKLDTLGGMLYLDYTGTLTRSRSYSHSWRRHDSVASLDFDRCLKDSNPSQWHGVMADVALPYSKHGEVALGLMASIMSERKGVEATDGGFVDSLRSYAFSNGTRELSVYAGAEHHFGHLTLGASLSMDHAWYDLDYSHVDSGDVRKHCLTFSPTVHASYSTESMHNFTFSYTHHVMPPTAKQLSCFTVYGYDSYSIGNPGLKNGYADKLELGWERYFDHLGSIGFSAWLSADRDRTGTLTDVAFCDRIGRIVAYSEPFNIGTARLGGISLNTTLRPADFMNIRFYANLFDDYYRVQYRPGMWKESELLCYSLRLNFWAKVLEHGGWFEGLQLFANVLYRSRTQTLLAEVDPYFSLDCGLSTDLFDRRVSLFLNVADVFGTVRTGASSVNPYNSSVSESTTESQYISFGLTWRLGRTEMESRQTTGKKSSRRKADR